MTMLKSFDLKGNKQSFANWISNLSPTETPFISMIPKQKVDQTQYSWQIDRLSQPGKEAKANAQTANSSEADTALKVGHDKEGEAAQIQNMLVTSVYDNHTQIFRKAVRVTDTTKKISLYGRNAELAYQMEKAGLEIKRDLEHALLNSPHPARPGTAANHSICAGVQLLVAAKDLKDPDTQAIVHKMVTYTVATGGNRQVRFTKAQVWDLTYNLYLVGSRANKIMFHPMHMSEFSDWIGNTKPGVVKPNPHLHRMFDGIESKYNAYVKKVRDPLGQEFTLIPNRHMPKNQLFFFNESDWTQMVLREPEKIVLAKMGSSEKHMIEMEVGLRVRHPFASGILEFNEGTAGKDLIQHIEVIPPSALANNTDTAMVKVYIKKGATGEVGTHGVQLNIGKTDGDGNSVDGGEGNVASTVDGTNPTNGVATFKLKVTDSKAGRAKIKASFTNNGVAAENGGEEHTVVDFHEARP